MRGRLVFTPRKDRRGYDFAAQTRFDRLFAGIASPRPSWMPHGPSGVENPHDEDYGRLLDRIYALRVASLMPASWNQIGAWLERMDELRRAASVVGAKAGVVESDEAAHTSLRPATCQ